MYEELLAALDEAGVRFVVGGVAAQDLLDISKLEELGRRRA